MNEKYSAESLVQIFTGSNLLNQWKIEMKQFHAIFVVPLAPEAARKWGRGTARAAILEVSERVGYHHNCIFVFSVSLDGDFDVGICSDRMGCSVSLAKADGIPLELVQLFRNALPALLNSLSEHFPACMRYMASIYLAASA